MIGMLRVSSFARSARTPQNPVDFECIREVSRISVGRHLHRLAAPTSRGVCHLHQLKPLVRKDAVHQRPARPGRSSTTTHDPLV
jgi:hypothetical protein